MHCWILAVFGALLAIPRTRLRELSHRSGYLMPVRSNKRKRAERDVLMSYQLAEAAWQRSSEVGAWPDVLQIQPQTVIYVGPMSTSTLGSFGVDVSQRLPILHGPPLTTFPRRAKPVTTSEHSDAH